MPPPNTAVGDLFLTTFPQHVEDQVGEVTVHWSVSAVTGVGDSYDDVINTIDQGWKNSGLKALACTSVTFRPARLYVLDPATGLATQIAVSTNSNILGTDSLGLAPIQAAPVITKTSSRAGRSGRGRCYHPFPNVDQLTFLAEMKSTYVTALNTAYNNFVTATTAGTPPNTATFVPVLLHRNPLPLTSTPITLLVASGMLGTQKRRGDYGRTNP